MPEQWRPIPGFHGYSVSDRGRVWSEKRKRPYMMKIAVDGGGYPLLALRRDGRLVTRRVHLLVLAAFVGPRPPGAVVRHLDGDPGHCVLSNLAYGSHTENALDAVRHGTHVQASKTHCANGHEFTIENTYVRRDRPNRRECKTCRAQASARWYAGGESHRMG